MSAAELSAKLIEVEELSVAFRGQRGATEVLSRASFAVAPGEIVGIVGESGSGKSVMALAIMRLTGAAARKRVVELLGEVGISSPVERAAAYPHQLSGGLRQRVMIAMAMACRP